MTLLPQNLPVDDCHRYGLHRTPDRPRPGADTIRPAAQLPLIGAQRRAWDGGGRQRNIDAWADRLHAIFATEVLDQLPLIEAAMGRQTQALVLQFDAACRAADLLAEAAAATFAENPDAAMLTSFPSIGPPHQRPSAGRDRR